jgi:GNAT superfamily N-acetyltransferase
LLSQFSIRRLEPTDRRLPFNCGDTVCDKDLNDFFLNDSIVSSRNLLSVTYSLESTTETVAFYSVINDRIIREECARGIFERIAGIMPREKRYGSFPSVKVARFGVTTSYQNKNIGTALMDYIKINFIDMNKTGCRFITVDAYNRDRTIKFYSDNGFNFLTNDDKNDKTRAMYFDLMPIANLHSDAIKAEPISPQSSTHDPQS